MRRRGWGNRRGGGNGAGGSGASGNGSGGGGARLLERLRELRGAGLRDLQPLSPSGDVPDGIALASARWEGNRPVAIVAARREGLELLGWARVAARRAGNGRPLREVFIAAPFFSERTRRAAARAGELGLVLHLLSLPGLADSGSETFEIDDHPTRPAPTLFGGGATLLARVLRVIEGAAAVTSAGGVRPAGPEYLVFVRGEQAARVSAEGEGVSVALALARPPPDPGDRVELPALGRRAARVARRPGAGPEAARRRGGAARRRDRARGRRSARRSHRALAPLEPRWTRARRLGRHRHRRPAGRGRDPPRARRRRRARARRGLAPAWTWSAAPGRRVRTVRRACS